MMKHVFAKTPWLAIAVAGIVSVAAAGARAETAQAAPVKLKVHMMPFLSFAPFLIAQEEGFFREQGLEIEFVKAEKMSVALPELVRGEVHVGAGIMQIGLLQIMDQPEAMKIVADKGYIGRGQDCAYVAVIARRDLLESGALATPAQLKGKKVAVEKAGPRGYVIERLLASAGLTFDDISVVNVPDAAIGAALDSGSIDLALVIEPWVTQTLQKSKAQLWKGAQDIIPDFQWGFITYSSQFIKANPQAGERFMAAYLKGVRQYNAGKTDRNLDILAKYQGSGREVLQQACWPPIRNDGSINVQSVLDFEKWSFNQGWLKKVAPVEEFWDGRFIKAANQALEK
jgi:ABC-type nitrate/sulfonate/bicarbonate transport system substrate-binding protein